MIPINNKKRSAKGFSIVELIIALAITAIAIVAIYNLFISQQKGFMIQEEVGNMQQNNRVAMEELARVIKMAGVGVQPPQQKILYCGPFDFAFNGNLNGAPNDVMAMGAVAAGGAYVAPDPSGFASQDAESYRWTLDANNDGDLTPVDYTNTGVGSDQYSLWRQTYTGTSVDKDEVSTNMTISDPLGNTVVLFQYWGNFDDDAALDLWGDANGDGELQVGEIVSSTIVVGGVTINNGALDSVTDLTGAGRALDDMLKMVDVTVITETSKRDPNYPTNSGFRQTRHNSMVTPRNLWTCANINVVPGYKNTLKVSGDTATIEFVVTESGIPKQDKAVNFNATIGGADITTLGGTIAPIQDLSDSNGLVSVTIGVPICGVAFPLDGVVTVMAVIPAEVTPFGPCSADSDTASLTMVEGDPNFLDVTTAPSSIVVLSCGDNSIISSFEITVKDACNNPVPSQDPFELEAFGVSGAACFGGFGTVTPSLIPINTTSVSVSYTSEPAGPYIADRFSGNSDQFEVFIADNFSGAFNCLSPLVTLYVEVFPDIITDFDPANNPITNIDHYDCNHADMKSTDATFSIEDSCLNNVFDLTQLTKTMGANVVPTLTPDPNGVLNNPGDQGTVAPASITTSVGGLYTVTYIEPSCTLPPLYTDMINPSITLTPINFVTQGPITFGLDLYSCTNCEIISDMSILNPCVVGHSTDATAAVTEELPNITAVFCGIEDGTSVELEVESSGGPANNATFDPADPNVPTIIGTFSSNTFTTPLYVGNARNGDTLTLTAYSPNKATYTTDPAGFTCSTSNLISVLTLCTSIRVSDQPISAATPEITAINSDDTLYVEVKDCGQNKNSTAIETIPVTFTSPKGYNPLIADEETVILTETGLDTGIFNSNVTSGGLPGPLPVIYCGLGESGDISGNGRLFVRTGNDVTVQYIDPDDPVDNGCKKTLTTNPFNCPAFVYAYYAQSFIHLDRHNINAQSTLRGNIFTNGELELGGSMTIDCRGPDGTLHTPDDETVTALGHISCSGQIFGDVYAPSIDLYGPDGEGQNSQSYPPHAGDIIGDIYLQDGYKLAPDPAPPNALKFFPEVIGSRGNVPLYGGVPAPYTSLAASALFQAPPGSSVVAHGQSGGATHTGVVYARPLEPGYPYDPNVDSGYALPPPNGKVNKAVDLPKFDFSRSVADSQDMSTAYHQSIGRNTYFTSMAEFNTFIQTLRTYTPAFGPPYTSPRQNPQNQNLYIIGDPYEGTIFHFTCAFDLSVNPIVDQLIVHGAIVSEANITTRGPHRGLAFYGCGKRPKDWINGFSGQTFSDYDSIVGPRGGEEDIPYDLIALVAQTNLEVMDDASGAKGHVLIKGIAYAENEVHIHNDNAAGKSFLFGAEIADVVHNCSYMDFTYNSCVTRAGAIWFGCSCDSGGGSATCKLAMIPSSTNVTVGGNSVTLTALNSLSGSYSFSRSGSAGGTISAVGDTVVYTSGAVVGIDTITVQSANCTSATATINVVNSCNVVVIPATFTLPINQSTILSASSVMGGPFHWDITQNQSLSTLDMDVGDSVTFNAGPNGGTDVITVTDDGGCQQATITITVDPCIVIVELFEFDGMACTGNLVDNVDAGGDVCAVAVSGDPASPSFVWSTDDPAGLFYDVDTGTWVGSGVAGTTLGVPIRYRTGTDLGTYTITAEDVESCAGTHLLSTCDITLVDGLGNSSVTIFAPQSLDLFATVGLADPVRTVVSWMTDDPGGAINLTDPINNLTATYTPSGPGTYEVTIQDNVGCISTVTVTVDPCPAITINPVNPTVNFVAGNTELFTALGGVPPYTWTTSDNNIGRFLDPLSGVFTPIAQWPVAINVYATDSVGCQGMTFVTVQCPVIEVNPANTTITLAAIMIYPSYTANFGSPEYSWSSSNPAVATIDAFSGTITDILGPGVTTITATDSLGCQGNTTLTIECPAITINPPNPSYNIGDTDTLTAVGGAPAYSWSSSAPAIVDIDPSSGFIKVLAGGTATITVTDDYGCTGTTTVTGICPVVTIAPANPSYTVGDTDTFTAAGGTGPYTYSSSNPAVVSIIPETGFATMVGEGSSIITVTDSLNCTDTTTVTATCPVIRISPVTPTYLITNTDTFIVIGGGTPPYTWSSSVPAVGSIVPGTGAFTAVSAGTTFITVTDMYGCTATTPVVVNSCSETINVTSFNVRCDKQKITLYATSDAQPDVLDLQFVIYSDADVQVFPAVGRQTMDWEAGPPTAQYSYVYEWQGDLSGWNCNYYVIVYSQDCPIAQSPKFSLQSKTNCGALNCP